MKYKHPLFILVIILLATTLASGQLKVRTIDKATPYPMQPVEVLSMKIRGEPFSDDGSAHGDEDWLKDLSLDVKNVSGKNIRSFDIELLVKRNGRILLGIPIFFRTYTRPGPNNAFDLLGDQKVGVLLPGEIIRVKILNHVLGKFAAELGADDVEKVTLKVGEVYFEDQSSWRWGRETRPDPQNPDKRIRVYDR